MDKKCTSCGKIVYPLEQLKCLDQIWHKQCFKCAVCGMTLNMKNYKGLEKKPYCSAHYPQPKAYTFVSDNPEMQRVKQNTAVISNIKYHEEFEKSKGVKMAVTEDMLQPAHGHGASGTAYAAKKKAVPSHPVNAAVAAIRRGSGSSGEAPASGGAAAAAAAASSGAAPGSIFEYDPERRWTAKDAASFDPNAAKRGSTIYSSEETAQTPVNSAYTGQSTVYTSSIGRRQQQPAASSQEVEADNHGGGAAVSPRASAVDSGGGSAAQSARYSQASDYSSPRHSGYAAASGEPAAAAASQPSPPSPVATAVAVAEPAPVSAAPPAAAAAPPPAANSRGKCYRAIYDYVAQDDDEVAFNEGDVITNGDPIDEGWMYGIVERTGQYGMLPSNYVEELL